MKMSVRFIAVVSAVLLVSGCASNVVAPTTSEAGNSNQTGEFSPSAFSMGAGDALGQQMFSQSSHSAVADLRE